MTLIVFHELNHPAKAIESHLLFGLTFFLVTESAELAPGRAFQGLEYLQGRELDLGELVRARNRKGEVDLNLCGWRSPCLVEKPEIHSPMRWLIQCFICCQKGWTWLPLLVSAMNLRCLAVSISACLILQRASSAHKGG